MRRYMRYIAHDNNNNSNYNTNYNNLKLMLAIHSHSLTIIYIEKISAMQAASGVRLRNLTASLKTLECGVFTVHKIKTAIKHKNKIAKSKLA